MVQERVINRVDEPVEHDLGDDCAELARSGGDTVPSGSVASGEDFAWDDERRGIRPEVLE